MWTIFPEKMVELGKSKMEKQARGKAHYRSDIDQIYVQNCTYSTLVCIDIMTPHEPASLGADLQFFVD